MNHNYYHIHSPNNIGISKFKNTSARKRNRGHTRQRSPLRVVKKNRILKVNQNRLSQRKNANDYDEDQEYCKVYADNYDNDDDDDDDDDDDREEDDDSRDEDYIDGAEQDEQKVHTDDEDDRQQTKMRFHGMGSYLRDDLVHCFEYPLQRMVSTCEDSLAKQKTAFISQIANFLHWCYVQHYHRPSVANYRQQKIPIESTSPIAWFATIIKTPTMHNLIGEYLAHVQDKQRMAPGSVLNVLVNISKAACWIWLHPHVPEFESANVCDREHKLFEAALKPHMRTIRKMCRIKQITKNNIQQAIDNNLIPAGGLPRLRNVIVSQLPWAKSLQKPDITKPVYMQFLQLLISAFYATSAQGRVGNCSIITIL